MAGQFTRSWEDSMTFFSFFSSAAILTWSAVGPVAAAVAATAAADADEHDDDETVAADGSMDAAAPDSASGALKRSRLAGGSEAWQVQQVQQLLSERLPPLPPHHRPSPLAERLGHENSMDGSRSRRACILNAPGAEAGGG
mmetsp:Transcript_107935/g.344568  ORF Transcript_107935/g.344568 Transcript_107935/m.344568 type:complete len:141 (+) Transcript_107935:607-1029(+)